jgi:hypothetical protein
MSEILAARAAATRDRVAAERETQMRRKDAPEREGGAARILERIRTIFRFKR